MKLALLALKILCVNNVSVIEEDEVDLAPKIPVNQLFPYAFSSVIVIILILAIAVYIMECQKYRVRILRLQSYDNNRNIKVKKSWNLKRLKIQTKILEEETVERTLGK